MWQILKQTKKNQEKYKYFSLNYQLVTIQLQTSVWLNFSFVDAKRPQAVTDIVSVFEETRLKAIRWQLHYSGKILFDIFPACSVTWALFGLFYKWDYFSLPGFVSILPIV